MTLPMMTALRIFALAPLVSLPSAFAQGTPTQVFPIAPQPRDSAAQQLRDTRGMPFNFITGGEPIDSDDPRTGGFVGVDLMMQVRPELPADASDAIVVGTISSIQPYLSQSHSCIYTEFSVHVEKVIDQISSVPLGGELVIDETGGNVMLPSGRVLRTEVIGVGNPLTNIGRYLFFLKYVPRGDSYRIVKAWELTDGRAKAMAQDDLGRAANRISRYDGLDVQAFLAIASTLKTGIKQP